MFNVCTKQPLSHSKRKAIHVHSLSRTKDEHNNTKKSAKHNRNGKKFFAKLDNAALARTAQPYNRKYTTGVTNLFMRLHLAFNQSNVYKNAIHGTFFAHSLRFILFGIAFFMFLL